MTRRKMKLAWGAPASARGLGRCLLPGLLMTCALGWTMGCGDSGAGGPGDGASGATSDAGDVLDSDALAADADTAEEVFGGPDRSTYTMKITLYDETVAAELERDITSQPQAYSYGSAHIGTAVAFAVTETMFWPSHLTVTFDFGKVVGMPPEFPIQTSGTGDYPFSASPPAVEVFVESLQYKSLFEGAEGQVSITEFGSSAGDVIAGTYAGRLIQDVDKPLAERLWVDVEGDFHFVIPDNQDF